MKKILFSLLLAMPYVVSAQFQWQALPNSPQMSNVAYAYENHDDIKFCDNQTGWICNIGGEIHKTSDGGDSWTEQVNQSSTGAYSSYRCLAFINCDTGYVGNLGPGDWVNKTSDPVLMYKTYDGGATWSEVTTIPNTHNPKGICGMQALDDGKTIVAVGRYDDPAIFFKSTDKGLTWTTKDIGASEGAEGLVDIHFFNPDTGLICGKRNGKSRIWYTTDGGNSFTQVETGNNDHTWKMYFVDRMNGYAMVSDYGGGPRLYHVTTDGGVTWAVKEFLNNAGDGQFGIYEGLGIGFFDTNIGWCAGSWTTYETTNGGASFKQINIDPTYDDNINRFIRVGPNVYAVGFRVYKYTDITVGEAKIPEVDNSLVKISCNPNPITGVAEITYTTPIDGHVRIGITGIGGRVRELLINKEQKAGTYTVIYNPTYNVKFVACTIEVGRYAKSVNIIRSDRSEGL